MEDQETKPQEENAVDMNKDLSGMDKNQIDDYLTLVEKHIDHMEDRLDVVDTRKARAEQFMVRLNLAIKKQKHLIGSWKRYFENTKRKYFRSWYRTGK